MQLQAVHSRFGGSSLPAFAGERRFPLPSGAHIVVQNGNITRWSGDAIVNTGAFPSITIAFVHGDLVLGANTPVGPCLLITYAHLNFTPSLDSPCLTNYCGLVADCQQETLADKAELTTKVDCSSVVGAYL